MISSVNSRNSGEKPERQECRYYPNAVYHEWRIYCREKKMALSKSK